MSSNAEQDVPATPSTSNKKPVSEERRAMLRANLEKAMEKRREISELRRRTKEAELDVLKKRELARLEKLEEEKKSPTTSPRSESLHLLLDRRLSRRRHRRRDRNRPRHLRSKRKLLHQLTQLLVLLGRKLLESRSIGQFPRSTSRRS